MATRASSDLAPLSAQTQGWAGGTNLRDAITLLQPNEARIMENGVLDERGGFSKRLGSSRNGTFGVGADRAVSLYTYYRAGLAPQVLMHTSAGKLYYTTDPWADPTVWTLIVSGLSATERFSFETFNGKAYLSNGVDNYASWDGATYTTFSSAPKARYLRIWKDTMWASGVPGLPDRVYESTPGDAETWPVSGWIDLGKGDGDEATGLASDGYTLIVFKRRTHRVITDPVTLNNRIVDFEKGCESHFSIIQFEGQIYFLSRRGICQYYGDSPSRIISGKIDPFFTPQVLNLNALSTVFAYTIENRIGWAIPETGQVAPSVQVEYYPRLGPISPYGIPGIGPFAFQRLPGTMFTRVRYQNREDLFGPKPNANAWLQFFALIGTDDGASFTAILETKADAFGAPSRTKYIRDMRVMGRGRFTVLYKKNFQAAIYKTYLVDLASGSDTWNPGETWGTGTWGPDAVFKEKLIRADAYVRYLTIRFTDSDTAVGSRPIPVGSLEYAVVAGEWAIYSAVFEGEFLGVRD